MKKVLVAGIVILLLSGCGGKSEKDVKTISDFETACLNNGYSIVNKIGDYKNDTYITEAKACKINDEQIEMVIYDNDESAKSAQDRQIKAFKTLKSINNIVKKESGNNYYHYMMISNGYYMATARVDNTLVFTKLKAENEDSVNKIFDELDY